AEGWGVRARENRMSDILIGAILFGLVFGAAIFGMFLDSQSTNYDSRNDLRFADHIRHPVQKQGRPVPRPAQWTGRTTEEHKCIVRRETAYGPAFRPR